LIEEKQRLIDEFEEMLKGYREDKDNLEHVIKDLQGEYD
jgi:hypothetical protein